MFLSNNTISENNTSRKLFFAVNVIYTALATHSLDLPFLKYICVTKTPWPPSKRSLTR